jgi:para-nitrobenzyl esterase
LDSPDGAAAFTSGQAQLANTMKSYWTQFARTSDPNGNGAPAWAAYQQDSDNGFQQLVAPTPQPSGEDNWLYDHRCLFWTGY